VHYLPDTEKKFMHEFSTTILILIFLLLNQKIFVFELNALSYHIFGMEKLFFSQRYCEDCYLYITEQFLLSSKVWVVQMGEPNIASEGLLCYHFTSESSTLGKAVLCYGS
jgi:hypothetical protein